MIATYEGRDVAWQPHAGPQTAFLASTATEALYGGAAGGGKSDAILYGALAQVHLSGYRALILRRTFPELRELMDRALGVFSRLGGTWNEQAKRWRWASGAVIEFGYCETYADVLQYQGDQFQYVGWDELGQIAEERCWTYLMSRVRRSATGQRLEMRASANPGGAGHYWLKSRFVDRCPPDGTTVTVEGQTRAFFRALLSDNPTLMEHDPEYGARLRQLPDLEYRWLALGDWSAGGGLAFPELADKAAYFVTLPKVPAHWFVWGALDWGYNHPWRFGLYAQDDAGTVVKLDTIGGRQMQPPAIAERMGTCLERAGVPKDRLRFVASGHDLWADVKARSENIPTLAEQFAALLWPMVKANISRIAGVQNCRRYFAGDPPMFRWVDTPGNRLNYECMASRISDPDEVEDVLKVDADPTGKGGDDDYDETRYGLAARPAPILKGRAEKPVKQDDRAVTLNLKTKKRIERLPQEAFAQMLGEEPQAAPHPRPQGVPRW